MPVRILYKEEEMSTVGAIKNIQLKAMVQHMLNKLEPYKEMIEQENAEINIRIVSLQEAQLEFVKVSEELRALLR